MTTRKQIAASKKRGAKFNERGTIDCEIEHPRFGWIPFTADPNDVEEHGRAIFEELRGSAAAYVPELPPQAGGQP